jgi:hypothetical protein
MAMQAVDAMWELFQDDNAHVVSDEIATHALNRLCETAVFHALKDQRFPLMVRCIENIRVGNAVPASMHLCAKILENFPSTAATNYEPTRRADILTMLNEQYGLIDAFLMDLERYKVVASQVFATRDVATPEARDEYVVNSHHSYRAALHQRLMFLAYIITSSNDLKFSVAQIAKFWSVMYVNALTPTEAEYCVRFLRDAVQRNNGRSNNTMRPASALMVQDDVVPYILEQFLSQVSPDQLTVHSWACFLRYFLIANSQAGNLVLGFPNVDNEEGDFWVQVKEDASGAMVNGPRNLIGYDFFWRVVLEGATEVKINTPSIEYLTNLHERLPQAQIHHLAALRSVYLETCFAKLKTVIAGNIEVGVRRCLALITQILDVSERSGYSGLRAHGAQLSGATLTLQVANAFIKSDQPKKFPLKCFANDSLRELRAVLARTMKTTIDNMEIRFNAVELDVNKDSKLLHELQLKHGVVISIAKRDFFSKRVKLITPSRMSLTQDAKRVLAEIFEKYATEVVMTSVPVASAIDVSDDDNDDDEKKPSMISSAAGAMHTVPVRFMTQGDMRNYILSCGVGDDVTNVSASRLQKIFDQYGVPVNGNKYVRSLERMDVSGFLEFYFSALTDRANLVWNDLTAHGYRYDLTKEPPYDEATAEAASTSVAQHAMPRYLLSANAEYFNLLFQSLTLEGKGIADTIWALLMRLPTNPVLHNALISLDGVRQDKSSWNTLLDSSNMFKLLYALQIIESLTEPVSISSDDPVEVQEASMAKQVPLFA